MSHGLHTFWLYALFFDFVVTIGLLSHGGIELLMHPCMRCSLPLSITVFSSGTNIAWGIIVFLSFSYLSGCFSIHDSKILHSLCSRQALSDWYANSFLRDIRLIYWSFANVFTISGSHIPSQLLTVCVFPKNLSIRLADDCSGRLIEIGKHPAARSTACLWLAVIPCINSWETPSNDVPLALLPNTIWHIWHSYIYFLPFMATVNWGNISPMFMVNSSFDWIVMGGNRCDENALSFSRRILVTLHTFDCSLLQSLLVLSFCGNSWCRYSLNVFANSFAVQVDLMSTIVIFFRISLLVHCFRRKNPWLTSTYRNKFYPLNVYLPQKQKVVNALPFKVCLLSHNITCINMKS